jgi:hypothetical protein
MAAVSDPRKGVVYISQELDDAMRPVDWFNLHWENPHVRPPTFYEEGPRFSTAEEAIQWGRERARVVLIRVGPLPQVYYSAGDDPPESVEPETVEPHAPVRPWPDAPQA